jgi:uncharacterized RDD family membrane protein YckC
VNTTNPYAPPKGEVRDVAEHGGDPADRLLRLGAVILDGIVLACMVYIPGVVVLAGAGRLGGDTPTAGNEMLVAFGGFLMLVGGIAWIWLTILFVARNGQTIAKKLVGIKVVRSDGSPASLGRIFWLRNVVNGLLGIIPLYGLIDILFIFGEQRQCLHDKIADTIVVKA